MDTNVLRHYTSITYVLAHIWLMIEASECKSLPRVAGCESRDCNSTCIGALGLSPSTPPRSHAFSRQHLGGIYAERRTPLALGPGSRRC
jgi:hypothetical protein